MESASRDLEQLQIEPSTSRSARRSDPMDRSSGAFRGRVDSDDGSDDDDDDDDDGSGDDGDEDKDATHREEWLENRLPASRVPQRDPGDLKDGGATGLSRFRPHR